MQRVGAGTRRTHLAGWIAAIAVTAVVVVVAGGAIATRATSPSTSASLLQVVNTYEPHEGTVRGTSQASGRRGQLSGQFWKMGTAASAFQKLQVQSR